MTVRILMQGLKNQEDPYKAVLKQKINNKYEIINWNTLDNITLKDIIAKDLRIFAR